MSSVRLDASRAGFGGIHGGHLAAVALGAMASLVGGDRPPRSLTLALLSPIAGGELGVLPKIEHAGRTLTAATVRLRRPPSQPISAGLSPPRNARSKPR